MRRMRHSGLAMLMILGIATSVAAEDITLTTYYPSPRGVYDELRTEGNTFLATNPPGMTFGGVVIGSTALPTFVQERLVVVNPETTVILRLESVNAGAASILRFAGGATRKWDITARNDVTAGSRLEFRDSSDLIRMMILQDGRIGIGMGGGDEPEDTLHVVGDARISGGGIKVFGTGYTPTAWEDSSSDRIIVRTGATPALSSVSESGGAQDVRFGIVGSADPGTTIFGNPGLACGGGVCWPNEAIGVMGNSPNGVGVGGYSPNGVGVKAYSGGGRALMTFGQTELTGAVGINRDPDPNYALRTNGNIYVQGTVHATSDMTLKTNILPLAPVLERLGDVRGVYFQWKDEVRDFESGKSAEAPRQIGVIAQELKEAFPELVSLPSSEDDYMGVDYLRLNAVLLEAIKELKARQEHLEQDFKKEQDALQQRISELERRLSQHNQDGLDDAGDLR